MWKKSKGKRAFFKILILAAVYLFRLFHYSDFCTQTSRIMDILGIVICTCIRHKAYKARYSINGNWVYRKRVFCKSTWIIIESLQPMSIKLKTKKYSFFLKKERNNCILVLFEHVTMSTRETNMWKFSQLQDLLLTFSL